MENPPKDATGKVRTLSQMFNDGALGELLAKELGGTLYANYPKKDSDFIISFKDEISTPTVERVWEVVSIYYKNLGVEITEKRKIRGNILEATLIIPGIDSWGMTVTITTRFPMRNRANLRVTCYLLD